jgi:hypothetical protein
MLYGTTGAVNSIIFCQLMLTCTSYYTYPNEPGVDYPEGFQGNSIPVDGPTVARLIEDHVDRKSKP